MRIIIFPFYRAAFVAALLLWFPVLPAQAGDGHWTEFVPVGNDVCVSYTQVAHDTWTWKFKNVGPTRIRTMFFEYRSSKGWEKDVLPFSLEPGRIFGGWAAFTSDVTNPEIRITSIKRAD